MNASLARLALTAAGATVLALCLSSCWYTRQAASFLAERAKAKPVAAIASDPATPEEVSAFLATVERVRQFSVERIGLSPTRNYTRYVAVDKDYVADVVSACASDSFERYRWRYPLLGALPYKGFYRKADATKEAARLKEAGLDVIVRPVEAFSSLGYFTDPLYSFMVGYDEDVIAELVIHESAHATLFVKGADQFNEEFATFVGRKGTELYLEEMYGTGSPQLTGRHRRAADGTAFVAFLQETALLLDGVYQDGTLTRDEKLARKSAIIAERAAVFREEAGRLFSGEGYRGFDMGSINNAYIDLYRLYEEDLSLFDDWFVRMAAGSLPSFVSTLSDLAKKTGQDIKKAMIEQLARL